MDYIASISYGKDSLAMLEIIKQHNMPLDRIVHVEIMATPTIPADLPPMMEFKAHADKIIKSRYGIEVEHLSAPKSYEEYFYRRFAEGTKNAGKIYGWPVRQGAWCNSRLKLSVLNKLKKQGIQYIGIACDEPNRFHNLNKSIISPLVEHGITEMQCFDICSELDLLSPIYQHTQRGGCWFCHNQRIKELRRLRKVYPEYWALMMKWDNDSSATFKSDGKTLHDYDKRFAFEDMQVKMDIVKERPCTKQ